MNGYEMYEIEYEFEVGQRVLWRGGFGSDPERVAVIVGNGTKNNRPVYDLDNGHWAYEDQLRGLEL